MRVKLFIRLCIYCYLLVLILGCTSILVRSKENSDIYPGVQTDVDLFVEAIECKEGFITVPRSICVLINVYAIVDMPFSTVLDTLFLPIDLNSN